MRNIESYLTGLGTGMLIMLAVHIYFKEPQNEEVVKPLPIKDATIMRGTMDGRIGIGQEFAADSFASWKIGRKNKTLYFASIPSVSNAKYIHLEVLNEYRNYTFEKQNNDSILVVKITLSK